MSSSVAIKLFPRDLYVYDKRFGTCFSVKYPFFSTSNCLKSLRATASRSSTMGVKAIGRFSQLRYLLHNETISYSVTLPSRFWSIAFNVSLSELLSIVGGVFTFSYASRWIRPKLLRGISEPFPYWVIKSFAIFLKRSSGRLPRPLPMPLIILSWREEELKNPLFASEISPKLFFG